MAPSNRVIIDTDPGVDDILALLLAFSASPEELEVLMVSVTYGNVDLQSCLRNVMTLFHVLDKEFAWRRQNGRAEGYETLKKLKPLVALGAEHSLVDEILMADHFHGADGLHGVHKAHPHLSPVDTWKALFDQEAGELRDSLDVNAYFTPSKFRAHKEILRLLRENEPDTVSIIAIGPLTNIALAAAEDPETLLRAKELVVMSGAIALEGNVTPVAEFNCYADAVAAARVYALTSPSPASTMPVLPAGMSTLAAYPPDLSRSLRLTLFPLDITTPHSMTRTFFADHIEPHVAAGSPLAQWAGHFVSKTFDKIDEMEGSGQEACLSLHDPMTVWYLLTRSDPNWKPTPKPEDIRIETTGQWTRGMHVVDRRMRSKPGEAAGFAGNPGAEPDLLTVDDVPGDTMGWLSLLKGNRINRMVGSPGEDVAAPYMLKRIFDS